MFRYIFISLLLIVLSGCSVQTPVIPNSPSPISPVQNPIQSSPTSDGSIDRLSPSDRVPRISIEELLKKITNNETMLIIDSRVDVAEQFSIGHISGAVPVPLAKITSGEWMTPSDKNLEIVIYCT
jgi:hypothetical protein